MAKICLLVAVASSFLACTHSGGLVLFTSEDQNPPTEENFRQKAHAWVGVDGDEVVRDLGRPHDQYAMPSGNTVLHYQIGGEVYTRTAGYAARSGAFASHTVTRQREIECAVEFEIDRTANTVKRVSYAGDACRSRSAEGRLQFRQEN